MYQGSQRAGTQTQRTKTLPRCAWNAEFPEEPPAPSFSQPGQGASAATAAGQAEASRAARSSSRAGASPTGAPQPEPQPSSERASGGRGRGSRTAAAGPAKGGSKEAQHRPMPTSAREHCARDTIAIVATPSREGTAGWLAKALGGDLGVATPPKAAQKLNLYDVLHVGSIPSEDEDVAMSAKAFSGPWTCPVPPAAAAVVANSGCADRLRTPPVTPPRPPAGHRCSEYENITEEASPSPPPPMYGFRRSDGAENMIAASPWCLVDVRRTFIEVSAGSGTSGAATLSRPRSTPPPARSAA